MPKPGNYRDTLILNTVPAGTYSAEWIDPTTGVVKSSEKLRCEEGNIRLITPPYSIDIALRILKQK